MRRAPFLAWRLAPIMCTAAGGDSTKSPFRRREAFDFLVALTRQSSSGGATAAALVPDMFTAVTRTFNEVAAQLGTQPAQCRCVVLPFMALTLRGMPVRAWCTRRRQGDAYAQRQASA